VITTEPTITVGIIDHAVRVDGTFSGTFRVGESLVEGEYSARIESDVVVVTDSPGNVVARASEVVCKGGKGTSFSLNDVVIGIGFHWEQKQRQTFTGELRFIRRTDGTLCVCNVVPLEEYLVSVISSEMSGTASLEFLKAHAITSRSWLVAMLDRARKHQRKTAAHSEQTESEITRWYDREDHDLFDVCADDHCQRYQGVIRIVSDVARNAVVATRGQFLLYNNAICDARFSKCCGGLSERYESCWDDNPVSYLQPVADSVQQHAWISDEASAAHWIRSSPDAFCNTADPEILAQILPSIDRSTRSFFRWSVEYTRSQLEEIIARKSGLRFGTMVNLVPITRGPSGRIVRLRIEGSERSIIVGKELEIRRWLSDSHLYSSAFVVERAMNAAGLPDRFRLVGAGWGHGVGLCQIGAAVMAQRGFKAEQIASHYFTGATLQQLYE
jgi:stage II sporulation protein D